MFRFLLFYFLTIAPVIGWSQSISGKILDDIRLPMVGANVSNVSKGTHTHSDALGMWKMNNVRVGDTLKISHLGFSTHTHVIQDGESVIQIVLSPSFVSIEEVVISPDLNALQLITTIDIQVNPVNSSQEVLRQVPGLIIGQHAGGGKAEQIFLRGFDIDHGTDISINVDGIPVNMVSHAHGQGYADLHFLIPETIDNIDFGKGPYKASNGNFNTAGYVNFNTKRRLDHNMLKLEVGDFNTQRVLGMFDIVNTQNANGYLAAEYLKSDGPFDSPQNFDRLNLFGKYHLKLSDSESLGLQFSHFTSEWDASGQIPIREVLNGNIGRFGAIDDTEGGITGRSNFKVNYDKFISNNTYFKNSLFYSHYDFELYSNFTFFLNDPVNGDQIRQKEDRSLYGLKSELIHSFNTEKWSGHWKSGVQIRVDDSDKNELSRTLNRTEIITPIQLGNVDEMNGSVYTSLELELGKWVINPGLRFDYFDFQYIDQLSSAFSKASLVRSILSPKLNVLYNHSSEVQAYIKSGGGFHSNDARIVLGQEGQTVLPAAYGVDIGTIWKPTSRVLVNLAYWYLHLEEELVYVGDEGVVEPSGETRRHGMEMSTRYQISPHLFSNVDINYTHARSVVSAEDGDYIPLAPNLTFQTGMNYSSEIGPYGGFLIRHVHDRPANEFNSITAEGYTVVDLNAGYDFGNFDVGFQIQNLLNTEWNETQFATESRLMNEGSPVEEIHFTPGTPFFIKGVVQMRF